MSVAEPIGRREPARGHFAQFFDSDESRAQSVAAYLADGCRAGERLLAIAHPRHWATIADELERLHVSVPAAILAGSLVVKDAVDTLRRLSRSDAPDAALFDDVVGKPVAKLSRLGGIRVYGELADLLALRGDLAEAVVLERLSNRLAARYPMTLMCGYSAAHFVAPATHPHLVAICGAHAHVHTFPQDPLASWLLNAAHTDAGETPRQH